MFLGRGGGLGKGRCAQAVAWRERGGDGGAVDAGVFDVLLFEIGFKAMVKILKKYDGFRE